MFITYVMVTYIQLLHIKRELKKGFNSYPIDTNVGKTQVSYFKAFA